MTLPGKAPATRRTRGPNLRPLFLAVTLGLCLALPLPHAAGAEPTTPDRVIRQAEAQILNGAAEDGITALTTLGPQADRAQELRRLWALAMAQARSDRPRAALPHLERLVSLAPENATFRVELAAALERAGQTDRARHHYDLARGAGLDSDLGQEIARRIDRIDRTKTWEGSFGIALTPESNAARRTAADTIFIGNLPFRLRPEAQAKAAQGVKLNLGIAALPALGPDLRARIGLSAEARLFEGTTPDDVQTTAELGLVHFADRSQRIGGGLLFSKRWIDAQDYSTSQGGYLTWSRSLGAQARSGVALTLLHDVTDFDGAALRRTTRNLAALRLTHLVSGQMQLRLGLTLERSDSRLPWESGDRTMISIGAQYAFRGGVLADLDLSTGHLTRDATDPFFGIRRKEDRHIAQLRLTHRDWTIGGFAPVLELGIEKQRSSNSIYSYDNTRAAIGLTRRF